MTIPVLTRMKMLENRMVNKEMCFYLNKAHQANPPSPTNPEVKIVRNQELTVFVHTFGGYANKDSVNLKEGRRFAEVLRQCTVPCICRNHFNYLSKLLHVFVKGTEEGWAGGGHRPVLHGQLRQPHEVLEQEERSHVSCAWDQSLSFDCAETNTIDGDINWSITSNSS